MANPATIKTAPNVIQVAINARWNNLANITNVQYWEFDSAPDSVACRVVTEAALGAWQDNVMDILSSGYAVLGARWLLMSNENSPTGDVAPIVGKPSAGAGVAESLPQNNAMMVHKICGESGRAARNGRLYLPGGSEGSITSTGVIQSTALTQLQTALDAYHSAAYIITAATTPATMAQPHWLKGNRPPVETGGLWAAQSVSAVTSLLADSRIATQRRRLR